LLTKYTTTTQATSHTFKKKYIFIIKLARISDQSRLLYLAMKLLFTYQFILLVAICHSCQCVLLVKINKYLFQNYYRVSMYNFFSSCARMYLLTYNLFNVCTPHTIMNRAANTVLPTFFSLNQSGYSTRGHNYKLCKNHCRVNIRQHFFTESVVQPWNALIASPQDFSSINMFKRCLRKNNPSKFLNN